MLWYTGRMSTANLQLSDLHRGLPDGRLYIALLILVVLLTGSAVCNASEYTTYWSGNVDEAEGVGAIYGGLLLMGGGGDVDEAMRAFLRWAGGGDVVVLRASGSDGYNDYLYEELGVPVDSVLTIRCESRAASSAPEVLAAVRGAEAVFLAGGDQDRYLDYWMDTPLQEALQAHVDAGKPLGGTSAGLMVLGEFIYGAREPGALDSRYALRRPLDKRLRIDRGFLDINALESVLLDSHFSERSRAGRLVAFLARAGHDYERDAPVGIGIDEATALLVSPEGRARVVSSGKGRVHVLILPPERPPMEEGAVLEFSDITFITLGPDSRLDLATWSIDRPEVLGRVEIKDERLRAMEESP